MYGRLEEHQDRWRLRFVRRLSHPPTEVWRALTEPEDLAAWFPATIEGDRAPGAALRFVFPFEGAPILEGEMITYDPPRVLEFRWDTDLLRFELEADGDGTRLTFLVTFDQQGKAARDAVGWHVCLDALAARLAGEEPTWEPGEPEHLKTHYVEAFGPEAATVGPPEWAPGSS